MITLCQMIYEILQSAHRPSDSHWRLIFSLPINTFSALGVSHVMCSIHVRYLRTELIRGVSLTYYRHVVCAADVRSVCNLAKFFFRCATTTTGCRDSNISRLQYRMLGRYPWRTLYRAGIASAVRIHVLHFCDSLHIWKHWTETVQHDLILTVRSVYKCTLQLQRQNGNHELLFTDLGWQSWCKSHLKVALEAE